MARRSYPTRKRRPTSSRPYRSRRNKWTTNRGYRTQRKRAFDRLYKNPFSRENMGTKLTYQTNVTVNPNADNLVTPESNVWVFQANSLFDPDFTGVGHQPMYFDNWKQIYSRYRVNFARITVTVVNTFVSTASVNTYSYKLAIVNDAGQSASGVLPVNMTALVEQGGPNVKWRYVSPSFNGRLPKLKATCSPHRVLGLDFKDDSLRSYTDASPGVAACFFVCVTSADGFTDPPQVTLSIKIDYYAEFFDRITQQPLN